MGNALVYHHFSLAEGYRYFREREGSIVFKEGLTVAARLREPAGTVRMEILSTNPLEEQVKSVLHELFHLSPDFRYALMGWLPYCRAWKDAVEDMIEQRVEEAYVADQEWVSFARDLLLRAQHVHPRPYIVP